MALWRMLKAPLVCCVTFILIFISLKNDWIVVRHLVSGPEYGLLLFLLPGVITALLTRDSPLFLAFIGGLFSIPICFILRWIFFPRVRAPFQEIAYAVSAIFWCVVGAMLVHWAITAYCRVRSHKKGAH